jgi:hypothetical protein
LILPLFLTIFIDSAEIQYGLEGGESMLPALDSLFSSSSQGMFNNTFWCKIPLIFNVIAGIQNIILGLASLCPLAVISKPSPLFLLSNASSKGAQNCLMI